MADLMTLAGREAGNIRKEIEELEHVIAAAPDGHLKCCRRGPYRYYYIIKTEGGNGCR